LNVLAQWVQIITQIITAITAVVVAYYAYQTYLRPPEQSEEEEPENAEAEEAPEKIGEVLVFKTAKQRTFLSVSEHGLHCRIANTSSSSLRLEVILSGTATRIRMKHSLYWRETFGLILGMGTFA
jgi:hypothetical protein